MVYLDSSHHSVTHACDQRDPRAGSQLKMYFHYYELTIYNSFILHSKVPLTQRIIKCASARLALAKRFGSTGSSQKGLVSKGRYSQIFLSSSAAYCQVSQLSVKFRSRKILSAIRLQHLTTFYCERVIITVNSMNREKIHAFFFFKKIIKKMLIEILLSHKNGEKRFK